MNDQRAPQTILETGARPETGTAPETGARPRTATPPALDPVLRTRTAAARGGAEWIFGGVYGTILSSALLAALQNEGTPYTPFYDAAWVLVTVGAAALVHGYAHHMSSHGAASPEHRGAHRWKQLGRELRDEWPMVAASLPTVLLLCLAGFAGWGEPATTAVGLGLNTALLFAWGVFAALRTGYRLAPALLIGLADAAIGLAIVVANALIK
ncbi:hypothetical protein [Streptomyces sp. NPDC093225]|uniref:hypothetical protein n=1 Tax=Streptomyces sp. NPDC093225 TaxID=3366034 RepID=UPI0038069F95